jgi:hypothetical protein
VQSTPSYYAIIPASVRYNKNLKAIEKLLYGEITALANIKGYCYATNKYFADLYGIHKNTAGNNINNLIKNNFIKSVIIFKDGTREILERRLYLNDTPLNETIDTPLNETIEDNNTSINNTSKQTRSITKDNNKSADKPVSNLLACLSYEDKRKLRDVYIELDRRGFSHSIGTIIKKIQALKKDLSINEIADGIVTNWNKNKAKYQDSPKFWYTKFYEDIIYVCKNKIKNIPQGNPSLKIKKHNFNIKNITGNWKEQLEKAPVAKATPYKFNKQRNLISG